MGRSWRARQAAVCRTYRRSAAFGSAAATQLLAPLFRTAEHAEEAHTL
jgi:hypothetical protein